MELVKKGKTKDVYKLADGNYLLRFKDTITGHIGGGADPGGNSVVGSVDGVAASALKVTTYYFELLKSKGISSHYVSSNIAANELVVRPAVMFGQGLEFVCRYVVTGSFLRRYALYCSEGQPLNEVFEVTLKDDERNDPPITCDSLVALKLLTIQQYQSIEIQTKQICRVVQQDLQSRGIKLYDIKLEFGVVGGEVVLIDEISGGNMRAYKDGTKLDYTTLSNLIISDAK